eukprot:CAMPEP_0170071460 /NCGR_PEP_ID=MMETSP0019_2-20121128/9390_1 /TAXON_ID=98059 /ORGANISM="Dinobryon sp., Strain UTEXLB2267" /LENGTH=258 /DNA_ID=CAMNT_0010280037 /DNA_START=715 /DNA_END=1488 /DNA_ORIENTATION=-
MVPVIATVSALHVILLRIALQGGPMPFEYPPYGLWSPAVVWSILVWFLIVYVAVGTASKEYLSPSIVSFSHIRPASIVLVSVFVVIGLSPYMGIRNYPALAMFSNLRTFVEGRQSNHLLLPLTTNSNFNNHDYVTIHHTDLPALLYYQVDLGRYFTPHVSAFNIAMGVSNEFWITPPSWSPSEVDQSALFKEYSIPFIEFRRSVTTAMRSSTSGVFWVKYSLNGDKDNVMFLNSSDLRSNTSELSVINKAIMTPLRDW